MAGIENGNEERQLLFTKVGWIATAYDTLAKGMKKEQPESAPGEIEDEDEEDAGEPESRFESPLTKCYKQRKTRYRLRRDIFGPRYV